MNQRLFIGTTPENCHHVNLQTLQQSIDIDAKPVALQNLHMTIAFLGQVTKQQQRYIESHVSEIHMQGFKVQFDCLHLWHKPQVLCLLSQHIPAALLTLHDECTALANSLNLHISTHGYQPHITLFRKAKTLPSIHIDPIVHTPTHLNLYVSESTSTGVEYRVINSWPLDDEC